MWWQDNSHAYLPAELDYTWAWKTNITGPAASFRSLTQYYVNPEFWSVTG